MVALQFLVLPVQVRVLVRQRSESAGCAVIKFYGAASFFAPPAMLYTFSTLNKQLLNRNASLIFRKNVNQTEKTQESNSCLFWAFFLKSEAESKKVRFFRNFLTAFIYLIVSILIEILNLI